MKVHMGKYLKNGKTRKMHVQIDPWDMHSLDYTLAKIIHPALTQFRNTLNTHPTDLTFDEWKVIVDKMALAFELTIALIENEETVTDEDVREQQIEEGMQLFAKWFRALWR